jgi:hypothetical protein
MREHALHSDQGYYHDEGSVFGSQQDSNHQHHGVDICCILRVPDAALSAACALAMPSYTCTGRYAARIKDLASARTP